MKDYLFVNPFLDPPGGGEGVANWMLQVLASRGRVTVLTWEPPDFRTIDAYYGTSLSKLPLKVASAGPLSRPILTGLGIPHRMLSWRLLQRRAWELRKSHRHCFSAFNLLDLGEPAAVQYVHHPFGASDGGAPVNPWAHNPWVSAIWPLYLWFLDRLFRPSRERMEQNITLTNSFWTARAILSEGFPAVHRVLYPPPLGRPRPEPAARRRKGFVSVGRLDPSKNWVGLVKVVEEVRQRGHDVSLTLAGSRYDEDTLVAVQALLEPRKSWLSLHLDPPRAELDQVISQHAFGIHGMKDEHYGMAVAELVLAGCVTFVHDSGGQVEIVPQTEVRYKNIEDAVQKISAVLSDDDLYRKLRAEQREHSRALTRERFLQEFGQFLDELENGRVSPIGTEVEWLARTVLET